MVLISKFHCSVYPVQVRAYNQFRVGNWSKPYQIEIPANLTVTDAPGPAGLSNGGVVGITLGAIVVAALLAACIVLKGLCCERLRRRKEILRQTQVIIS